MFRDKNEFILRWLTPTLEINLCGHATLAAAHILWTEGFWDKDRPIIFNLRSGKLVINLLNDLIEMNFPSMKYSEVTAVPNSLIEVATEEEVRGIQS